VKVRKKILIIDREPRVTGPVRQALESVGRYSIREEHDATFAVHVARWFQPDLIMVDLTMSATDGELVAQQLQSDRELSDTPLLCLSKFVSGPEFLSAGILSGYSFLASPVPIEHLIRAVDQMLFDR
jgi:CheY-like chemotaxis protein